MSYHASTQNATWTVMMRIWVCWTRPAKTSEHTITTARLRKKSCDPKQDAALGIRNLRVGNKTERATWVKLRELDVHDCTEPWLETPVFWYWLRAWLRVHAHLYINTTRAGLWPRRNILLAEHFWKCIRLQLRETYLDMHPQQPDRADTVLEKLKETITFSNMKAKMSLKLGCIIIILTWCMLSHAIYFLATVLDAESDWWL